MKKRTLLSSAFFLGSFAVLMGLSSPVQAGFQWVAPTTNAAPSPAPQTSPSYNPLIIDAPRAASPAPEPLIIAPPAPSAPTAKPEWALVPPDKVAPPAKTAETEVPVQGFANKIPLSVALRQVLPPGKGFTLASGVNSDKLVSWRGGRSWREVLQDMLQDTGLGMEDQGDKIVISRVAAVPAPAPTANALPMPVLQPPASAPLPESAPLAPMPQNTLPNFDVPAAPFAQSGEPTVQTWTAERGQTLRHVFEDWTRRANVELSWQAEYDYPLQASVTLSGSFEEAARNLLVGFQEANPQPIARLHNNPAAGKPVMVVQARGNNYTE